MSRYIMVRLIPCQSPDVRPIVVMPGGTRYTLARYGKEFSASSFGSLAKRVAEIAATMDISHDRDWVYAERSASFDAAEEMFTMDLDTGAVRRWDVVTTVDVCAADEMKVHR